MRVRKRSPVFYQNVWGFAFAVPALVLLLVFSVYPVLNALYIGFTTWSLSGTPEFVGLDNYITMFLNDPENTKDTPWLSVQLQDLEVGVPVPLIPKYQELAKENLEMLERVYDGAQTVSESVAEFCQKLNSILAS